MSTDMTKQVMSARLIGLELGLSAKDVNLLLAECGFLAGAPKAWNLTQKGMQYGRLETRQTDDDYYSIILWSSEIVELLKDYAPLINSGTKEQANSDKDTTHINDVSKHVITKPSGIKYVQDVSIPFWEMMEAGNRFSDSINTIILRFFNNELYLADIFYNVLNQAFEENAIVRITVNDNQIVCKLPRGRVRFSVHYAEQQFYLKFRHKQRHFILTKNCDIDSIYTTAKACKKYLQNKDYEILSDE